jgi:transposase-like protein
VLVVATELSARHGLATVSRPLRRRGAPVRLPRRGPPRRNPGMKHRATTPLSCPFRDCASNCGDDRRQHVVRHSRLRTRKGVRSRLLCRRCQRSFLPGLGTPYHRMQRPRRDFDSAIRLVAEGVSLAAIARSQGVATSTVSRWIDRAARHARAYEEQFARVDRPIELQLDELRSFGAVREMRTWVYNAIEVGSRFWLGSRVGTRTLRNTLLFARTLRSRCASLSAPFLVTSDEFKYYLPCLRRAFGPACVYVQVKNRYARGRLVRSKAQLKLGTEWTLERARERSEDSKRPNTAYVERLNLHIRRSCAYLHRRTPSPMRKPQRLADVLDINRLHYNFVRRHSSLRLRRECRTPAMQAGITSRPLTLREIFSWIPPHRPYPPPVNSSPTPIREDR